LKFKSVLFREAEVEASQPQKGKLPQQLKPAQRKSDPVKFPLEHDKWRDNNGIVTASNTVKFSAGKSLTRSF